MSVVVDGEGQVCVAHEPQDDARPVKLLYTPGSRIMTLHLDNGRDEILGFAAQQIAACLEKTRRVTLTQRLSRAETRRFDIPLLSV